MKNMAILQWAMIGFVIAILSELFSGRFAPSTAAYVFLRYVLPIGFSAVGLSLLFLAVFREQKGR